MDALKLMMSMAASAEEQGVRIMCIDISRAYFHGPAVRPVFVEIAAEDWEVGDEEKCGTLYVSMCRTRGAV